jgi:hypothetical protein
VQYYLLPGCEYITALWLFNWLKCKAILPERRIDTALTAFWGNGEKDIYENSNVLLT